MTPMSQVVDEVKARISLREVASRYTVLKPEGRGRWKGLCPFHQEKTPSFYVDEEKGLFYCFGCKAGGDIFTFVQRAEGVDFKGALERLAEEAGVEIPTHREEEDPAWSLAEEARRAFKGSPAEEYWTSRGLDLRVAEEMGAGYLPPSHSSPLRGRLIIPASPKRPLFLVGRSLTGETPKYLYHPRGRAVAHHLGVWRVQGTGRALIVVEGALDAARLLSLLRGHPTIGAVASVWGGRVSQAQAGLISRYAEVYLALDADRAGVEGMVAAINLLRGTSTILRVVRWPRKDPGECTPEQVAAALESPLEPHRFLWKAIKWLSGNDLKTALQRVRPFLTPASEIDPIPTLLRKLMEEEGVTLPQQATPPKPPEDPVLRRVATWAPSEGEGHYLGELAAVVAAAPNPRELLEWLRSRLVDWPPLLQAIERGQREGLSSAFFEALMRLPSLTQEEVQRRAKTLAYLWNEAHLKGLLNKALEENDFEEVQALLALLEEVRNDARR